MTLSYYTIINKSHDNVISTAFGFPPGHGLLSMLLQHGIDAVHEKILD